MRIYYPFLICFGLFTFGLYSCTNNTAGPDRPFPSLGDSLTIEQSCMRISRHLMTVCGDSDTASFTTFYHLLDSTGSRLRQSLGGSRGMPAAADSIIGIVYKTWNIGFDNRDMAPEALLPHCIYRTGKGACLGVSLIMLMLAEKTGCPLHGVMLPGHFFCRYSNGSTQVNIEPNKAGVNHADDYYKDRYLVASRPWYDIKRNLSRQETIGILCYNAGAICLNLGKNDPAIFYCRQAMRRLHGLPEATGNCALAYAQKGDLDSSLMLFKGLFSSHPDFINCAANYGTILMTTRQWKTAREVFKKGLEYYPDDTVLRRGLEKAIAP
jgi:hypothetical protein